MAIDRSGGENSGWSRFAVTLINVVVAIFRLSISVVMR